MDPIPNRREPRASVPRRAGSRDQRELDLFLQRRPWRRLSLAYRRSNPLCELCLAGDLLTPAAQVHHKVDRAERPDLALEWSNLQALCASCHSRITRARGKN